jgi:hypothetical protein
MADNDGDFVDNDDPAGEPADTDDVVPINFSWAPGQRTKSKIVLFNGKMFMKNKARGSRTYYSCRRKRADKIHQTVCKAAGYIEAGIFHPTKDNHV